MPGKNGKEQQDQSGYYASHGGVVAELAKPPECGLDTGEVFAWYLGTQDDHVLHRLGLFPDARWPR